MILLDLSPIIYSSFLATHDSSTDIDIKYIRHLILKCIRSNLSRYRHEYGELVICCDSRSNWRKRVFPYYKASRKKTRDSSTFNWPKIFECTTQVTQEIRDNFPYKTILVEGAEADDIIGVLTKAHANTSKKILIISTDKDFRQLHKYDNVKQVGRNGWIECADPLAYVKEHIMRGDSSDGIPNFLSDDDAFVNPDKKQRPLRQTKLDAWIECDPKDFCDENMLRNYDRNKILVDFDCIPDDITDSIMSDFNAQLTVKPVNLYKYFMDNDLNELIESLGDF